MRQFVDGIAVDIYGGSAQRSAVFCNGLPGAIQLPTVLQQLPGLLERGLGCTNYKVEVARNAGHAMHELIRHSVNAKRFLADS